MCCAVRFTLLCLLQVLEDVCQKHGFNPDEHGLKYVGILIISWPALLSVVVVKLVSGWLREQVVQIQRLLQRTIHGTRAAETF